MLLIHITDSQTDRILDVIDEDEFWDDKHYKSLKDTLETFDFTTFADKSFSEYLAKRNRIIIPDEDGQFVEFIIENTRKFHGVNGFSIEVYTSASYIELIKSKVISPQTTPAWTAKQHADFALAGTGWEAGEIYFAGVRSLTIEKHTNPFAYLKRLAAELDLELHFRVEKDGNKIVRRYVDLLERVGTWRGREAEFGKDLIGIERKENNANIVTALVGLGPVREDGTRLEVFVEDKDALARWGRNGQHLVEVYEPQSTDQDMTIERLTELTENELEKRVNSVVEYHADIADLEKVPGLEHEKIRFGDTIKIKDTAFNPALYLEARVHTQERSIKKDGTKKVTLGDYIEYTEEDVLAIWKSLQAEIAKKVSMSDVTEVVYTKPEVDDKDASVYQDSTYYADNVSETKKQEAIQVAATDATNKANLAEQAARAYADSLKQQTDQQINDVEQSISNLDTYVDGAFKDSVIQEAEAKAIEKYLNQLNAEKADIDAKYNDVYNNPSLSGTAKTNLSSKKSAYNTAHTNLINAINTAISDGKTTPAEKSDVDTKFSSYRTALSQLSTAFEDAIDAIAQAKAQQAENNAKQHAEQKAAEAQAAAEAVAIAEAELAETQAKAYADGIVTAEEQARIQQAQQNLAEAKAYAEQKAQEAQDAAEQYVNTQLTNYVTAVMYEQDIADLQNQIDGNITSWFYAHEPTLTNEPAVNWTTDDLKNQHLGDIFYNTSNGYSYRFAYENGTYKWLLLKDSDVQKALADAAKAQDTADAKRRVFVSQPVPPYDVGDLWVQGTNGDIMRCQTAKVAGQSYSSSDWVKASKYTDDTRAIQAEINAKSHADTIAEQKKLEAINAAIADADAKLSAAKTELEADIALKADAEWVNGQLVLKENAITKSNTAPSNPTVGQLWLDTSTTPNILKRWTGSAWVKATPTTAGEVNAYTKTEVNNALNSKVSVTQYNTDMNGVVTRLNSAESRITQNENEIATKVSNTTYQQDKTTINNNISQLQTKMSNAETSITQLSNQIALKANATDVYTKSQIDGQFSTVNQQISQLDAELSIQAGQIATKVSQTELQTAIDGIQVGGRNLARQTDFSVLPSSTYWQFRGNYVGEIDTSNTYQGHNSLKITTNGAGANGTNDFVVWLRGILPAVSDNYTISFYAKAQTGGGKVFARWGGNGGSNQVTTSQSLTTNWQKFVINLTISSVTTGDGAVVMHFTTDDIINIALFKIEKGNRATDWTPAPEDVQGQIDGLGTRVSSAETSITQMSNQIQLKANQTTVDTLANRISSAESSINLLSDEIQLKVDKDGIIAAINVSPEGVRISGNKVTIDGTTNIANGVIKTAHIADGQITNAKIANLAVDNAKIASLHGSKIIAGTITADQIAANTIIAEHIESLNGLNINDQFIIDSNGNVNFSGRLEGATGNFQGAITADNLFINPFFDATKGSYDVFTINWVTGTNNEKIEAFIGDTGYPDLAWRALDGNDNEIDFSMNIRGSLGANKISSPFYHGSNPFKNPILQDHLNGNVTLSALDGSLYLGYYNTTYVRSEKEHLFYNGARVMSGNLTLDTGLVNAHGFRFTNFTTAPAGIEGTLWYGNGYAGKGLYLRNATGWVLVKQ